MWQGGLREAWGRVPAGAIAHAHCAIEGRLARSIVTPAPPVPCPTACPNQAASCRATLPSTTLSWPSTAPRWPACRWVAEQAGNRWALACAGDAGKLPAGMQAGARRARRRLACSIPQQPQLSRSCALPAGLRLAVTAGGAGRAGGQGECGGGGQPGAGGGGAGAGGGLPPAGGPAAAEGGGGPRRRRGAQGR